MWQRSAAVVAVLACLMLAGVASASSNPLGPYPIDLDRVTVGGLSSGGFMAVQVHVALSSMFKAGASVFAGGPYGCAVGNVVSALTFCEHGPIPPVAVDATVTNTLLLQTEGLIDPLSNLKESRVFIFSGLLDTVVHQVVVKALAEFYAAFIPDDRIHTMFNVSAEHLMPTDDYGEACDHLGPPFIGNCNLDGAGIALQTLSTTPLKPRTTAVSSNFLLFDQKQFFNGVDPNTVGIADQGFVYVPTACRNGTTSSCALHLELHGCEQNYATVGEVYVKHSGFAEWAESNNIVVLFPQTVAIPVVNPKSCWDWYWGTLYETREGTQVSFLRHLVEAVQTGVMTPVPPTNIHVPSAATIRLPTLSK